MSISVNNEQCRIAANLLETEPGLLDYRLVSHLNRVFCLCGEKLPCTQVIALAIVQWQDKIASNEKQA